MLRRIAFVMVMVLGFGVALAAHYGSKAEYVILGFTADGKRVVFRKDIHAMDSESWYAIYDATTTKLVTSQPISRSCMMCENGKGGISEAVGQKTIDKLTAKYGAPVAATVLKESTPGWRTETESRYTENPSDLTAKDGFVQTFSNNDVKVVTRTKLRGKKIPPADGEQAWQDKNLTFDVDIAITAQGTTRTVKQKLYASNVVGYFNANVMEWPELYVQHVAYSPDGKTLAYVFARKPRIVKLPAAPATPAPATKP